MSPTVRALEKATHFDTAFVVEDLPSYKKEGGLSGVVSILFNSYSNEVFTLPLWFLPESGGI